MDRIEEIRARCEAAIELAKDIHRLSYSGELIIQRALEDTPYLLSEIDRLQSQLDGCRLPCKIGDAIFLFCWSIMKE